MNLLGISVPPYDRTKDPLFSHCSNLNEDEFHTTTQPILRPKASSEIDVALNELEACTRDSTFTSLEEDVRISEINSANRGSSAQEHERTDFSPTAPFVCDILCNSINKPNSTNYPKITDETDKHLMDHESKYGLLEDHNFISNNLFSLAYYQIMNSILLQNPLLTYQDMYFYPYQSGLLYSGFHSIINQLPVINNGLKVSVKQVNTSGTMQQSNPQCNFCSTQYKSVICLFYAKVNTTQNKWRLS